MRLQTRISVALVLISVCAAPVQSGDQALSFTDLMKMKQIRQVEISKDGAWIAYALVPDRGDGEAVVRSTRSEAAHRIERGSGPKIASDSGWAVATIEPSFEEQEKASAKKDKGKGKAKKNDKPKKGLALVDLFTGEQLRIEEVESFSLSEDGQWLAYKLYREEAEEEEEGEEPAEEAEEEEKAKEIPEEKLGTTMKLRHLDSGEEITVEHVTELAFSEADALLAIAVSTPEGDGNRMQMLRLGAEEALTMLHEAARGDYRHIVWAREQSRLAFTTAALDDDGEPGDAEVWVWDEPKGARRIASADDAPEGWTLPPVNKLTWSRDGERLFFGFKPVNPESESKQAEKENEDNEDESPFDPYDVEALLEKRGVDVWHWNDPRIIANQKKRWEKEEKDRTYMAVGHIDSGAVVPLADLAMPEIEPCDNPRVALGRSDVPYLKQVTWDDVYFDLYVVDLHTGERHLAGKRIARSRDKSYSLSPGGRFVIYYQRGDWHLYDISEDKLGNLTTKICTPFENEDHDYPSQPPGYGLAEWLADDSAVLVYDKYDIWKLFSDGQAPVNLTGGLGREQELTFRVTDVDPDEDSLAPDAQLLLSAYHNQEKHDAFYTASIGAVGASPLYETRNHRLRFQVKAEDTDRIIFTRERYDEFPDLWTSDLQLQAPQRLTDANPGISEYAWGEAELIEWQTEDGIRLQGILIKPGSYQPGQRYPVLTYYYRFFTQRLYQFNEPVVNHRPSFPLYASNGYAVFLPDIRFEVGYPGRAAVKCLESGIDKLVEMGIADADAIGLHGHSWSGYQTAFVVTQSNRFAAAVAGAPVSNMTSAYSGIRWGTGLARQFQYERSQSRIGGSLWEVPELYIANSPVFFADKIETPLLIQFGDEDEAVPWYQGIELYLACRRLGKECIFLQYRGEPHHLKQYPNKLDYSIKMKQFFDHHLKGEPAPSWMTEGVPYQGE
jgi:dipeptidyl aminopeptidase/acylaminoacyl peptidase